MKIDKFLDFLFRTRLGHIALLGGLTAGAFLFGGCLCTDMMSCACDDACDGCWGECDDSCNSCFMDSCGGEDCAATSCLFGDGCVTSCGDCVIDCGGCNSTLCTECNAGCGSESGGCGFSCFNCDVTCDGDTISTSTHTIVLHFFDTKHNTVVDSQELQIGKREEVSAIEVYDDLYGAFYTFEGYYFDVKGVGDGTVFEGEATDAQGNWLGNKNIGEVDTLYAKLSEKFVGQPRVVKFSTEPSDLGVSYADATVTVGSRITYFPLPQEVDGYKFAYWETGSGKQFTASEVTQMDFHLIDWTPGDSVFIYVKAVYEPVRLELKFDFGEGIVRTFACEYGTRFDAALHTVKTENADLFLQNNRRVAGWSLEANTAYSGDLLPDDYIVYSSETFYAVYQEKVTITYHYTKGPASDDIETEDHFEGDKISLPVLDNVGPNYFAGWSTSPSGSKITGLFEVGKEVTDLYARWSLVTQYEIRYHSKGEWRNTYELNELQATPLDYDDADPGYTFDGWCKESDLSDDPITELPAGTYGDIDLYAHFSPNEYIIYLAVISGATVDPAQKSVTYGEEYELPIPHRSGYDFTGWTFNGRPMTDAQGKSLGALTTGTLGVNISSFDNLQFVAQWKETEYTVEFKLDAEGAAQVSVLRKNGEEIGAPEGLNAVSTDKTGYIFEGWYCNGVVYNAETQVTQNMTFIARYRAKQYTVTLNANGGTVGGGQTTTFTITFGEKPTITPIPTHSSQTFLGWFTEANVQLTRADGVLINPFDIDDDHLVLYAHWA